MKYTVKVLLNDTPDHRFGHYEAGDTLIEVPGDLVIDTDGLDVVPEAVWSVGNKMEPDSVGNPYDPKSRSLSVGDVILVTGGNLIGFGAMFACETMGWKRLI